MRAAFPPEVLVANATARSGGAVGEFALVPAFAGRIALRGQSILDFGAGPQAIHAARLRAMGHQVTAHDFGENLVPGVHDPDALSRRYDVVFASNVLNVADTEALLQLTLSQIAGAVLPGGAAILNLPAEPRKRAWTGTRRDDDRLGTLLASRFGSVRRLPRLWYCRAPREAKGHSA
ncbi:MAG: hypothetical protein JWR10_1548 [Rubritepida sp.]|nr:hypothetical protein [Rubritepida sp.]